MATMVGEQMNKDKALDLALEGAANYIDALGGDSRKYRQALANAALDKKAENARELGLDYEPVQEPVAWVNAEKRTFEWNGPVLWNTPTVAVLEKIPLYTTPPNVATPLAAPVVPDVMTTAEGEHPEYVQGWNDCRQLMLQTRKNT